MAKGRLRTAVVDGESYHWNVREIDHRTVVVRIWGKAGGHGGSPLEVLVELFSPWDTVGRGSGAHADGVASPSESITPSRIPRFVAMGFEAGWSPNSRGAPFTIDAQPSS